MPYVSLLSHLQLAMYKKTPPLAPMDGVLPLMENYRNVTVAVSEDCAFMCYNLGQEACNGFLLDDATMHCQFYKSHLNTTALMPL